MKHLLKLTIILFVALVLGFTSYLYYREQTFVKNIMIKYTNVKEFIVKTEHHDYFENYIEVTISNSEKQRLLNKFKFNDDFK